MAKSRDVSSRVLGTRLFNIKKTAAKLVSSTRVLKYIKHGRVRFLYPLRDKKRRHMFVYGYKQTWPKRKGLSLNYQR